MIPVAVKKLRDCARIPTYGTDFAAGADLCAAIEAPVTVRPGETVMIPIGIAMEIPEGYGGFVYARSGMASKRHLAPANKVGIVDADYRGEIFVPMHNHGPVPQVIEPGERMAQMVIAPFLKAAFVEADTLSETPRGDKGFGSTGTK